MIQLKMVLKGVAFDANAVDYSKCVADQKPRSDCESADNMDDPLSLYYTMSLVEKHIGNEKGNVICNIIWTNMGW